MQKWKPSFEGALSELAPEARTLLAAQVAVESKA